uniref:Rho guanine nucleotide exchange factor 26 n=1 Tax=Xiphophorus couchianus TaxID=32473 RepID=A0A3B5M6A3_9TELE
MDLGNDVDLSNNNITPLWRRRTDLSEGPQDLNKLKPRPASYHVNGVTTADFPAGDDGRSFTLSQPAQPLNANTVRSTTNPLDLDLEKDHISSGTNTPSPETPTDNCSSHVHSPHSPNNYHYELSSQSSASSSSSPGYGTLTPSHNPPTPRSPSPADRGNSLQSQTTSPASSYDTLYASSSSSSFSTSPSLSPTASPCPTIVLSTNSPAALKMGTQQLIPKGLACGIRQTKAPPTGTQRLGLDHSKRAMKVLSMVEAGGYFSTGGGHTEEAEGENESPGALRRGLRSTSYRRAVVSEVDKDVSSVELKMPLIVVFLFHFQIPNRKKLTSQRTFDSEEEELYQNYQEKALHNDSDEDADSRGPKPDQGIVVQYRPIRTSWSQLSVVKKNGLADQLSQEERKRQEAIFELISSEHSYLHSLEILIRMFKNSPELSEAMTKIEHHHLFSNILDVCEASKKFFKELEDRHQQSIVIDDISDIVCKHAESTFDPYIKYCSNEVYQQRTLQKLVGAKNSAFKEVLTRLEGHPDCRSLPMISFLILPMQRITRLPLLLDVSEPKAHSNPGLRNYKTFWRVTQRFVYLTARGARSNRRGVSVTSRHTLIIPSDSFSLLRLFTCVANFFTCKQIHYLVVKRFFYPAFFPLHLFSFSTSEDSHTVIDYALRDQIQVGSSQPEDVHLSPAKSPTIMLSSRQVGANHLFRLCFRSNHSSEKVAMILGTELENERARWISALGQNDNDERRHDRTNVMQVEVIRTYTAKQPDELSLQVADVVLVSQHVDGWYEGERLRDGEAGWFPAECGEAITCQATIERNMQRMDRLQGLETNV